MKLLICICMSLCIVLLPHDWPIGLDPNKVVSEGIKSILYQTEYNPVHLQITRTYFIILTGALSRFREQNQELYDELWYNDSLPFNAFGCRVKEERALLPSYCTPEQHGAWTTLQAGQRGWGEGGNGGGGKIAPDKKFWSLYKSGNETLHFISSLCNCANICPKTNCTLYFTQNENPAHFFS